MVEPVLNYFGGRLCYQIPVNRSPNVTKNHFCFLVTIVYGSSGVFDVPVGY